MPESKSPLSPHLQVYRLPLVAIVSISHRMCGVINGLGYAIFVIFLLSIASGPEFYNIIQIILSSIYAKILMILWVFSFYLHLSNGIRHLAWDVGYGFGGKSPLISSILVMISTVLLTLFTVLLYFGT